MVSLCDASNGTPILRYVSVPPSQSLSLKLLFFSATIWGYY
ncbi:hypothetical protein AMTRI_Chr13g89310 [Amborella trichopoda]